MVNSAILEKSTCSPRKANDGTSRSFEGNSSVFLDGENDSPTQMNVRIGRSLKQRGDEVLASIGLTSSQGIRAFYRLLANYDNNPGPVEAILGLDDEELRGEIAAEREYKLESFHKCRKSIEDFCAKFDIKPLDALNNDPGERAKQYKQMRENAAWRRCSRAVEQ